MSIFSKLIRYDKKYPVIKKLKRSVGRGISDDILNLAYEQGRFKNCPRDRGKVQIIKVDW